MNKVPEICAGDYVVAPRFAVGGVGLVCLVYDDTASVVWRKDVGPSGHPVDWLRPATLVEQVVGRWKGLTCPKVLTITREVDEKS